VLTVTGSRGTVELLGTPVPPGYPVQRLPFGRALEGPPSRAPASSFTSIGSRSRTCDAPRVRALPPRAPRRASTGLETPPGASASSIEEVKSAPIRRQK